MSFYLTSTRTGGQGSAETWYNPDTNQWITFAFVRSTANGYRETLCYKIVDTFDSRHDTGDLICAYGEMPARAELITMSPVAFLTYASLEEITQMNRSPRTINDLAVTMIATPVARRNDLLMAGMPVDSRHYLITLARNDQTMTITYSTGPGIPPPPTLAQVLTNLCSDFWFNEIPFDELCSELGMGMYIEDSEGNTIENPVARATYNAIEWQSNDLLRLFADVEISDIERMLEEEMGA